MQRDMSTAFDEFAKEYPQARNQAEFQQFTNASAGVYQAFQQSRGRVPTYPELYQSIAGVLGWQPEQSTSKKDAAIKAAGSQGQVVSSSRPVAKQPRVTDAQVNAYRRMFPAKTQEEAVKELSEYVA